MKVLQINVDYDSGGPGTIAADIYNTLISQGHECKNVFSRGRYESNKDLVRIGNSIDVVSHALFSRLTGYEGYYSKIATNKLIKYIKDYDPDIIQLHNLLGHYINFPILFDYFMNCSKQIVWTIHDCSPFTGHCINFDRVNCEKWRTQCENCQLYNDYPYSLFFDTSKKVFLDKKRWYNSIDKMQVVVPSNWMYDNVKKSLLREKKIEIIHNGINLELFKPTESNLREKHGLQNKKVLLFVAYVWNEMKGLNIIRELSKKITDEYALVVIGNNLEDEHLKNTVRIPATNDKHYLAQWYSAADIFVNPTLGDNFPTVNIEALSCGTPIVSFNTGGSPEIVSHGCGKIVVSNTVDELIDAVNCVDATKETRELCRRKAQQFDRRNIYMKYVQLYEKLLSN